MTFNRHREHDDQQRNGSLKFKLKKKYGKYGKWTEAANEMSCFIQMKEINSSFDVQQNHCKKPSASSRVRLKQNQR